MKKRLFRLLNMKKKYQKKRNFKFEIRLDDLFPHFRFDFDFRRIESASLYTPTHNIIIWDHLTISYLVSLL
jgi:hypothetical protein